MPRSLPQAVLLVDGYNVIGAWSDLQQVRDRGGLEAARRELIEVLTNYSAFQDFETRIVFDAQYRDSPAASEVITKNLSVHYTDSGQTADSYIERSCALFRQDVRKFKQRLIVVTSDRAQELTVVGFGAECISAQRLAFEIDAAARQVRSKQKTGGRSSGRLANSLDPIVQQRLVQLRSGLEPQNPESSQRDSLL